MGGEEAPRPLKPGKGLGISMAGKDQPPEDWDMRNLTEKNLTQAVLKRLEKTSDPRLGQVLSSLVEHLHGFIRDIEPTEAEWETGIRFLTAAGQICDDSRQEFILLSDVLGATILADAINHRKPQGATESSVLGPFYRDGARQVATAGSIAENTPGEPLIVRGRVATTQGQPIEGALLDIWQSAPNGLYENQDSHQPEMNLRGKLLTDGDGRYAFRTVKPESYPIPNDGPAGKILEAMGGHNRRPAHIHFIVTAEGYEPVTTQIFVENDPWLDSDPVFGVKDSLVVDFVRHHSPEEAAQLQIPNPFYTVDYDFGMVPAG